jgi:hypothetical protein
VWEWQDGLKLVDGKIIMPADNHYSLDEASWPDTGVRFDGTVASAGLDGSYGDVGDPILSDAIINYLGPTGDNGSYDYSTMTNWRSLTAKAGYTVPNNMKQALIYPYDAVNPKGYLYMRNYGERLPIRGGGWGDGVGAGLGAVNLTYARSSSSSNVGFRPAYIM